MMKHKQQKIRGFTLVELMVAMTLGIFLIAGVGTVYISSTKTYKLQDQTSELDENARTALRALKYHIEHAGYASTTGMVVPNYIISNGTVITATSCTDGDPHIRDTTLISTSNDQATAANGDTIGIIYMADADLQTDCTGNALRSQCLPPDSANRATSYVYNSFTITNNQNNSAGDPIPSLTCGGSTTAVSQPWAEGIENLQFQYGIDSNGDGSVENYWNATDVSSSNMWGSIITVRVGLLVRSVDPVFDQAAAESYQVLDQNIDTNDRYRRSVYTTTIRLKNVARRVI